MTAQEYLRQNGRKCDGCGGTIGRFTSRCYFDKEEVKVYCSTGGCAEAYLTAPKCGLCGGRRGLVNHGGGNYYCAECTSQSQLYKVVRKRPNWFQVVRPLPDGGRFVRSAVADERRARQLAERFNQMG